jgi:abnormal spindle-like microcephaly-associated protein
LHLGLETVFGTVIPVPQFERHRPKQNPRNDATPNAIAATKQGPSRSLKGVLTVKQFILRHLLSDDQILKKYTGGKGKVPAGDSGKFRAELRAVVLERLILLIVFLDRAKTANVLDDSRNLFDHSAPIKSTRNVLLSVSQDFLQSRSSLVNDLSRIGIAVLYEQTAADELDFFISNLRADLSDGTRLVRLAEVFTGAKLLPNLRLPIKIREDKMHNVRIAIDHFAAAGVDVGQTLPYHIVDGHREMVLKLLLNMVGQYRLSAWLTVDQVSEEIRRLRRSLFCPSRNKVPDVNDDSESFIHSSPTFGTLEDALLQWANVVCNRFGLDIADNSDSWSSGIAICLVVHFYHPTLLPRHEIRGSHQRSAAPVVDHEAGLADDQANVRLVNACMTDLGMPGLMPTCDTLHPPQPKSIVLCLAFLCSRLMASWQEVPACILLQRFYRYHRDRVLWVQKKAAARIIVAAWQRNKADYYAAQRRRFGAAVATIETFFLTRLRRLQQNRIQRAEVVLQAFACRVVARHRYQHRMRRQRAAIKIQCFWRALRTLQAVVRLQSFCRGLLARIQFFVA